MTKNLLKKQEAAKLLGVSTFTLRDWRNKGHLIEGIHYIRFNSRTIRYVQESLNHWVLNRDNPQAHERYCQQFMNDKTYNFIVGK